MTTGKCGSSRWGCPTIPPPGLGLMRRALTPTSRLDLNGYLNYRIYAGPGEQGIPDALDRGVFGRFEKWQKLTSYNLTGSHTEIDTSSIQQQETGFATLSGLTITDQIGGGLRHVFGPRDAIQWQTTWTSTTFTQAGLTPTDNLTSFAGWTHNVSPITTLVPSLQFQHLTYHNASQSEVMFWTGRTALQTQLTKSLRLEADAGVAYLNATSKGLGIIDITVPTSGSLVGSGLLPIQSVPPSGSAIDWVGSINLIYTLKTAELALSVYRSIGPTTFGQFQKTEAISLSANYQINQFSSVSVSGAFAHQSAVGIGGSTDRINAGIAYNRTLAREWRAQLAYYHNENITTTGTARSNALYTTLVRNFTILP